ncbi:MAG: hypothetical protein MK180_13520 [Rhodobacteraceae bacterium]|nr:hypothetical protein [Paracoccaceae bacterium]
MRLLIATCLCLLAVAGHAQELLKLEGEVVAESEQDRTLISKASWLRGLHVLGTDLDEVPEPLIHAFMPEASQGEVICARITTRTGDYSAMVEFDVPAGTSQGTPALLEYEARSPLAIAHTPKTGGIALELGPCEGDALTNLGKVSQFYVNFWNQSSEPELDENGNATLVMHINVSRADTLRATASLPGTQAVSVPCEPLNDPGALAYNFECRLLLAPGVLKGRYGDFIDFAYRRVYRGNESGLRRAHLYLGGGNP